MTNATLDAIANPLLGWLKSVSDWLFSVLNSSGVAQQAASAGTLVWLSEHWVTLAVTLIVIGVLIDILVWYIRWQPQKVWGTRYRRAKRAISHK